MFHDNFMRHRAFYLIHTRMWVRFDKLRSLGLLMLQTRYQLIIHMIGMQYSIHVGLYRPIFKLSLTTYRIGPLHRPTCESKEKS